MFLNQENGQYYITELSLENFSAVFPTRPRGYKTFLMLSSAETKIYHAHSC